MKGYKITLQNEMHGCEVIFRDTLEEAITAVISIFETIQDDGLDDRGVHHRQVIIETD